MNDENTMKSSDKPIIIEYLFHTSVEILWNSLTNISEMRKWYFENIPDFKPVVGFKTQFNVKSEERNFLHKWIVTKAEYLKTITYNWEFEEYPGKSSSTFEIFNEGDKAKLKLTIKVLEDFPDDIPEFKRESCIGGWDYFLNNRLKNYLEA